MAESTTPFYYVETVNDKAAVAVYVNDVLVHSDRLARNSEKRTSINQWIHRGANRLTVNITVPPKLDEVPADFGATFKVVEYIRAGEELRQKDLVELSWKYDSAGTMPAIETVSFDGGVPVDSWYWYDADVFNEETIPTGELGDVVRAFHDALDGKNMAALEKLLAVKAREMATAFGIPLEERLRDQRKFFENFFHKDGWGMQLPALDEFFVYYHSGGRLLEVVDRLGGPLLHSKPIDGDSKFMLSLYLARKNGEWTLCR